MANELEQLFESVRAAATRDASAARQTIDDMARDGIQVDVEKMTGHLQLLQVRAWHAGFDRCCELADSTP